MDRWTHAPRQLTGTVDKIGLALFLEAFVTAWGFFVVVIGKLGSALLLIVLAVGVV